MGLHVHFDELAPTQRVSSDLPCRAIIVFARIDVEKVAPKRDVNRVWAPSPISTPIGTPDSSEQRRCVAVYIVGESLCRAANRKVARDDDDSLLRASV